MTIHVPTLSRACWLAAAVTLGASPAFADLPAIKAGDGNAVPSCATPGRMMLLLKARNAGLDPRFEGVATEYMRHGEALGVRWDYAFYQMILETGALTYKGDVKPSQNNFAGLGATGKGERGESFPDVATGVRAHLEHLRLYAGDPVDDPVAERTRKVREWGVLTSWQRSLKKPVTFRDLARKWAPWDKSYPSEIQSVAERFRDDHCGKPDPRPELVAEARGSKSPVAVAAAETKSETRSIGTDLARQALERARSEGGAVRSSLGAGLLAKPAPPSEPAAATTQPGTLAPSTSAKPAVTLLNPSKTEEDAKPEKPAAVQTASAATSSRAGAATAAPLAASEKAAPESSQCRVWTASYGGAKAIIIKSSADKTTNYTVLDVNEGAEKREAQAYIDAYARGGQVVGEFASPTAALDKAFDLCPE